MEEDTLNKHYPPRSGDSRNPLYDLTSYFYDYEGYYPPSLIELWERITSMRPAFPEAYKPLGTFWDADKTKVFKDPSRGGWFDWLWSERPTPRDALEKQQFYAADKDNHLANIEWTSLLQCEQKIGNYVLHREKEVDKSRQNHPLNYLYADLQRICKIAAEESNPRVAKSVVEQLSTYIRGVRQEMPSLSVDAFFLDDLLGHFSQTVKPQLEAGIDGESLRGEFKELNKKLRGFKQNIKRVTHFSGDSRVPVHPPLLNMAEGKADPKIDPSQALIDCANQATEEGLTTALTNSLSSQIVKADPFLKKDGGRNSVDTDLLARCPDTALSVDTEDLRKSHYLGGLRDLNRLDMHSKLMNGILSLFHDAGHINMVLNFSDRLSDYLKTLKEDMLDAQTDMNALLKTNEERKRALFLKGKSNTGFFRLSKALDEKEEAFLANQKTLEQLQYTTEGMQGIQEIQDTVDEIAMTLMRLSEKYQDKAVQGEKVALLTDINDAIETLASQRREVSETLRLEGEEPSTVNETIPKESPSVEQKLLDSGSDAARLETLYFHSDKTKENSKGSTATNVAPNLESSAMKQKQVAAALPSSEKSLLPTHGVSTVDSKPGMTFSQCDLQINPMTQAVRRVCVEGPIRATFMPKDGGDTASFIQSISASCDETTFKAVSFEGRPALYCEGDETISFHEYQIPHAAQQAEMFFNQMGGQLALFGVFFQMGKNVYQWMTAEPTKKINPISADDAKLLFNNAEATLKEIKSRNKALDVEDKWVTTLVENYEDELRECLSKKQKGRLSLDELKETKEGIDYLLAYVTFEKNEVLVGFRAHFLKDKLSEATMLDREDLGKLEAYFKTLSQMRQLQRVPVDKDLEANYQQLHDKSGLTQASLLDVAEMFFMINNLLSGDDNLRKSDLIDTKRELEACLLGLKKETDLEPINVVEDLRRLRDRANVWDPSLPRMPSNQPLPFFAPLVNQEGGDFQRVSDEGGRYQFNLK